MRDTVLLAEQERELLARRRLVVGDEDAKPTGRRHVCTPARYFGTRMLTFVPAPGAVSTVSP